MGRFIEVQDVATLPAVLRLAVGDALKCMASGGRVHARTSEANAPSVVEMLGPFVQSLMVQGGRVVEPAGPPNVVVFVARAAGETVIDVISGDPWGKSQTTTIRVTVGA